MPLPICKFSDHALVRLKERFDISPFILSDLIDNKGEALNLPSINDDSLIRAVALPRQNNHIVNPNLQQGTFLLKKLAASVPRPAALGLSQLNC